MKRCETKPVLVAEWVAAVWLSDFPAVFQVVYVNADPVARKSAPLPDFLARRSRPSNTRRRLSRTALRLKT